MLLRGAKQAIVIAGLIVFALPVPCVANAHGDAIEVRLSAVDLNPEEPSLKRIGELSFIAGYELQSDDARFGGLSGLSLTPDGGELLAVLDTGLWFHARLIHDNNMVLQGLRDARIGSVTIENGRPVDKRTAKVDGDAEAIERLPDGGLLVSFERRHRILHYPAPAAVPTRRPVQLPAPEGLQHAPSNSGLEAIAPLPDGRLLVLTENQRKPNGDRAGWLYDKNGIHAQPLSLRGTQRLKPTDLAVLPNGDALLLERSYTLLAGPGVRISLIPAAAIKPGARLQPSTLAEFSLPLSVDNFEGLAAIEAPDGGWLLYLISDDNFNPLQRTLLLQFHWRGKSK